MGCRAAILVTGSGERKPERGTLRLREHWDGEPTAVLGWLARATETAQHKCESLSAWYLDRLEIPAGESAPLVLMPARTFAQHLIFAAVGWHGPSVRIDLDDQDESGAGGRPAEYHEALKDEHFGDQGDLEWVYVIDLEKRSVGVYHGECGYGSPQDHLADGPCDPTWYAHQLIESYQDETESRILGLVKTLEEQGWTFLPPHKLRKAPKGFRFVKDGLPIERNENTNSNHRAYETANGWLIYDLDGAFTVYEGRYGTDKIALTETSLRRARRAATVHYLFKRFLDLAPDAREFLDTFAPSVEGAFDWHTLSVWADKLDEGSGDAPLWGKRLRRLLPKNIETKETV
jgi:hypothetical protein